MRNYYEEFNDLLLKEDRYGCIKYTKNLLEENKLSIVELYENILAASMINVGSMIVEDRLKIWQEHIYAAIVRSVLENTYTYVVDQATKIDHPKNVIVVCPRDEYHEIGPRMVADFYMLLGHNVTYIGANTPKEDFILSINIIKPDIIAISISTNYNSVAAKDMIGLIKEIDSNIKIVVGGNVFVAYPDMYKQIGADYQVNSFDDIKKLDVVNNVIL